MTRLKRLAPDIRRKILLDAALSVAEREGLLGFTMSRVGVEAGVSRQLVSRYFGSVAELKSAIVKSAIQDKRTKVIGHAVLAKHPGVRHLSRADKTAAVGALAP